MYIYQYTHHNCVCIGIPINTPCIIIDCLTVCVCTYMYTSIIQYFNTILFHSMHDYIIAIMVMYMLKFFIFKVLALNNDNNFVSCFNNPIPQHSAIVSTIIQIFFQELVHHIAMETSIACDRHTNIKGLSSIHTHPSLTVVHRINE